MSWPPALPARDTVREDERAAYDSVVARQTAYGYAGFVARFLHEDVLRAFPGDRVQPYFCALLTSPLIAAGMSDLGAVYRTRGEYPDGVTHADREWADLVSGRELGVNWVLYVHAPDAAAVGVRPEAILALVQGRDDELTEDELLKAEFIRAVARGTMTGGLYEAVETMLGTRATVELACFCGHMLKTKRLQQAFGVPDVTIEQLEEFVQAIVDGRVELPRPQDRVPTAPAPRGSGDELPRTYLEQALASLRTAETHISTEYQDDLDVTLATITKTEPRFAFMPVPGRIKLETRADGVRAFYESSRAVFQPAALRIRHQLTTDWYYLLEGVASRYGREDGREYTINSLTLFPAAEDGIVGEFLWERYDVPDPDEDESRFDPSLAPGARTDLPLRAVRSLRVHDRLVQGFRANDPEGVVADLADDFIFGARSYLPEGGPMVTGEGREAAAAYWRAFFDHYRVEELSVMNRLTADWYVFAEHAVTVTTRSDPGATAQQFRTAAVYPIVGGGRIQGELGYGTDLAPASTRERGNRGIAFYGRDDHVETLP